MSESQMIERATPLLDFTVGGADGRTVTALACTFGEPYAVRDQWGDYDEIINRAAFGTRRLPLGNVGVYYNHTLNAFGQPSDRLTMPVGVPVEIYPDARGLVTVTRYATTPLGDEVLTLIKDEVLRAQSFRGPVHETAPARTVGGRKVLERLRLGLVEYGPTVAPANPGALILAVRSAAMLAERLEQLTDEQRERLFTMLEEPSPSATSSAAPDPEAGTSQPTPEPSSDTSAAVLAALSVLEAEAAQRRRRMS